MITAAFMTEYTGYTVFERLALVRKYRSGKMPNVSDRVINNLITKGCIEPDTRRLTESGRNAAQMIERIDNQNS